MIFCLEIIRGMLHLMHVQHIATSAENSFQVILILFYLKYLLKKNNLGVTSHGYSCEVCKCKVHKRCVDKTIGNCKWTTLASVGKDIIEDKQGVIIIFTAIDEQYFNIN